jgi:hypothetical protein
VRSTEQRRAWQDIRGHGASSAKKNKAKEVLAISPNQASDERAYRAPEVKEVNLQSVLAGILPLLDVAFKSKPKLYKYQRHFLDEIREASSPYDYKGQPLSSYPKPKEEPMSKAIPPEERDQNYYRGTLIPKPAASKTTKPEMRAFKGGATRNTDAGKIDYEGFLSPFALKAYCEYLDSHRLQADGKMRDSDNWQSGFGPGVCMKSLLRHVWDAWMIGRGGHVTEDGKVVTKKDALCAAMFNIISQIHDMEKPGHKEDAS